MKNILFIIIIFVLTQPGIGQDNETLVSDSIAWAFTKIEAGNAQINDSTFAMECFLQALKIGKKYNDHYLLYKANKAISKCYNKNGWQKKSLYFIRKSIEHAQMSGRDINLLPEFLGIAVLQNKMFNYSASFDSLSLAEELGTKFNDTMGQLRSISLRIDIYTYLKQYDLALPYLKQGLLLAKEKNSGFYITVFYQRYGIYYLEKKQFGKAISFFKNALNYAHLIKDKRYQNYFVAYNYNRLGDIYLKQNNETLAHEFYLKSFVMAKEANYGNYIYYTLLDLFKVNIKLNDFEKAERYRKKLSVILKQKKSELPLRILYTTHLARLNKKLNRPDSTIFYSKMALKFAKSRMRKISNKSFRLGFNNMEADLYLGIADIYKSYFQKTGKAAFFDSTFKYVNTYRARTLYEESNKDKLSEKNAYTDAVYKIEKSYHNIRIAKEKSIPSASDLEIQKRTMLMKRFNLLKEQAVDYKKISRKDFQSYLESINSAAIIYTFDKTGQYALYLDSKNTRIIDLNISPDNLKNNIKTLVAQAFYNDDILKLKYNTKLAHKIYKAVWAPLEKEKKLPKNIIIIPDGNILNLPFDILVDEAREKELFSVLDPPLYNNNLLVKKYNFCYLPSANLIKSFHKTGRADNVLLVASPKFKNEYKIGPKLLRRTGWSFDPLLYSIAEVQSIKGLFEDYEILTGENATKEEVLARVGSSNIIHFATHAFVDSAFDLFSGLVLTNSGDSLDTGFLLGYEIDKLKLNSDLVTLSACESGRGKIVSSEGVMGLPRLFFGAGANSVLMTMWKIDDKQSAKFMPMFYKNIVQNKMSKMEALGETKRAFLAQGSMQNGMYYSYPFYWAAFNLYGDGGTQQISRNSFSLVTIGNFIIIVFIFSIFLLFFLRRKK
jgi:CHAT domain-containing protein